jgi:hypothetical protein
MTGTVRTRSRQTTTVAVNLYRLCAQVMVSVEQKFSVVLELVGETIR